MYAIMKSRKGQDCKRFQKAIQKEQNIWKASHKLKEKTIRTYIGAI
jgi:hypothetical protein